MGAIKEVSSAAMPYVILGGIVVGIYLFRDKIKEYLGSFAAGLLPDSLTTPANELTLTGTSDSLWSWWTSGTKDLGNGPVDLTDAEPDYLSGDATKSVWQAQMERWFGTSAAESVTVDEWMAEGHLTPGAYTSPTEPAFAAAVAATEAQSLVPAPSFEEQRMMSKYGISQEVAAAYLGNTYGLNFREWQQKALSTPEFAARVGVPDYTYQAIYGAAANGGVYLGPNVNPLLEGSGIAPADAWTIYNPATGSQWSGSQQSTSYLMGDSPEAAAWRERYL